MEKAHLLQPSQPQGKQANTPAPSCALGSRLSGKPAFADAEQERIPAVVAMQAQRLAATSAADVVGAAHSARSVPNPLVPSAGSARSPLQRRALPAPQLLSHTDIRYLQSTVGNRALAPLLQTRVTGLPGDAMPSVV
jgi:S1-C subfamily serine protease